MEKKTYEVIEDSNVVNLDNETVKTLKKGETVTGDFGLSQRRAMVELEAVKFDTVVFDAVALADIVQFAASGSQKSTLFDGSVVQHHIPYGMLSGFLQ